VLGTADAVGHFLLIKALEIERASTLSPFGYSQLLWVKLLGFLVFGQLPDRHAVIGMAIIVGSGSAKKKSPTARSGDRANRSRHVGGVTAP
jgi:drug/metabolite transporter (DMT)-like permease